MHISQTLKDTYADFLTFNLKAKYSATNFAVFLDDDITKSLSTQSGPNYIIELSGAYTMSNNPECFHFTCDYVEVDDDCFEYIAYINNINEK